MPWYHGRLFSRMNLLLLVGLTACVPKKPDQWPGRSPAAAPDIEARVSSPPAAQWREYSDLQRLALVNREVIPTNNHNPFEWGLRVRITPAALSLYEHWHVGAVMPMGTWVVAEHQSRTNAAPGPYYFASKTASGWVFGAATPEGALLSPDPSCARCHAEAPSDFVFGLPVRGSSPLQIDQRPDGG
jgi:hypothetical protein